MAHHRKHRGPHPEDPRIFGSNHVARMRHAAGDLAWLLTRGYAVNSALKLVGDRYNLVARQRQAIARCTCSDDSATRRYQSAVRADDLAEQELWIDGYNVLTSVEAALAGGVVLHARDGCFRDMASMHGSYRKVAETIPALTLLGRQLAELRPAACHWLFDQPVSNSGQLKTLMAKIAAEHDWNWRISLVPDPDRLLIAADQIIASSDSQILDRSSSWFNLARWVIETCVSDAWIVDLFAGDEHFQ